MLQRTEPSKVLRKRWWQSLTAIVLLVAPLAALAIASRDQEIVAWLCQRSLPGDLEKSLQLSEAFAHGSGVIAIFAVLLTVDVKRRRQLIIAAAMVVVIMIASNLGKSLFSRARPYTLEQFPELTQTWFPEFGSRFWDSRVRSFPSGHSATAAAMAFALSSVYPRGRYLFVTLALLACLQRIATQSHYPSDVFAGVTVAAAVALIWQIFYWPSQIAIESSEQIATASNRLSETDVADDL